MGEKRQPPKAPSADVILEGIKSSCRRGSSYRCPKCKAEIQDEAAFEQHLGDHLKSWQADLASIFHGRRTDS